MPKIAFPNLRCAREHLLLRRCKQITRPNTNTNANTNTDTDTNTNKQQVMSNVWFGMSQERAI